MEHKIYLLVDDDLDELIIFEEALKQLQLPVHVIFDSNRAGFKEIKERRF